MERAKIALISAGDVGKAEICLTKALKREDKGIFFSESNGNGGDDEIQPKIHWKRQSLLPKV